MNTGTENTIPWTHGLVAWVGEGMNLPDDEFREKMLSDPDWRAWLGKDDLSCSFEGIIAEEWWNGPIEAVFLPKDSGFKDGDRVKVTLEKIE